MCSILVALCQTKLEFVSWSHRYISFSVSDPLFTSLYLTPSLSFCIPSSYISFSHLPFHLTFFLPSLSSPLLTFLFPPHPLSSHFLTSLFPFNHHSFSPSFPFCLPHHFFLSPLLSFPASIPLCFPAVLTLLFPSLPNSL